MSKGSGGNKSTSWRDKGGNLSFKENSDSLIQDITAPYDAVINSDWDKRVALIEYTSGSAEINDVARNGKLTFRSQNSNDVEDWNYSIKLLDKAMDSSPRLSRDVDLFRGSDYIGDYNIKGKSVAEINKMAGKQFTDKAFTSFSFKRKVAEDIGGNGSAVVVLKAKKGLKGMSLANASSFNSISRQEEFLVARNTKYTIQGAKSVGGKTFIFLTAD